MSGATPGGLTVGIRPRERYGLVLILIFCAYVIGGFRDSDAARLIGSVIWLLLLLTALWSPGIPARLRYIGVALTIALFVVAGVLLLSDSETAYGVLLLLLAIVQLAAVVAILARISQHGHVTAQTVMGAVAGYTLIGFAMAALYHGLEVLTEGPFLDGVVSPGDYTYFSFVTLTTVGYGDITAASDLAKRLVVVEMLSGQIFLITLVARLVSLWGRPLRGAAD
ncbi:MAG: potassium channel protein [Actinobacteria bacterium]|nr:MAG: potassium channel protein [Actinomycetota bacterium]